MRYLLIVLLLLGLCYGAMEGYQLRKLSQEQTTYKETLADINRINYGLFNVDLWKDKAVDIFTNRIDEFRLNPAVYDDIEVELAKYLRSLYVEYISSGNLANMLIDEGVKQRKLNVMIGNLLKSNVSDIIRGLKLQKQIPAYAKVLSKEIKKNEPMLTGYLREALHNMLFDADKGVMADARKGIYENYGHTTLEDTNQDLKEKVANLEIRIDKKIKIVYFIVLGLILLSLALFKFIGAIPAISLLSFGSIILLLLGVSMPMIDIDARLNDFTMNMIGTQISFDEQYLYYQSKSIGNGSRIQRGWIFQDRSSA